MTLIYDAIQKSAPKKKIVTLASFQRQSDEIGNALQKAHLLAIHLKLMWDDFDELPPKQKPLYDSNLKTIDHIIKAQKTAYNVKMKLRHYK